MAKYFPGDYRIIPNGVDIDRFHPDIPPLEEFSDGRPNILFVGRFDPRKGLKYLLQAFPYILSRIPEARLIIVGRGVLKSLYKYYADSKVREAIHFAGYISPEMLPQYYATADVFVSPAIGQESFGIILLEAMASKKPIVASNIPGYRLVLTPNQDSLLVPPKNPQRLAACIIKLLKDPKLRETLGENGRKKALQYSWNRIARQIDSYYYEVKERVEKVRPS